MRALILCAALAWLAAMAAQAQDPSTPDPEAAASAAGGESGERAEQEFAAAMTAEPPAEAPLQPTDEPDEGLNLLRMASPQVGGIFMIPIYVFSFVVVLFGIERSLALRRRKVIPPELIDGFNDLLTGQGGFDPRKAYRLCQQYPSAAAQVLRSALLKIGRPLPELEQAVQAASDREATRLYGNIRPLNLSATVAPLLGLIGTVQGMIKAFYTTAHLPDGANKAMALAEGVYVALVTTFAGLCVAIPAVCLAHIFEGKIHRLFAQLDDLTANLLPVLERYQGQVRLGRAGQAGEPFAENDIENPRQPAATSE